MTLEDNERRLIRMVEQQREEQCRELRERAQSEGRELLRKTYRRTRRRLRAEAASERTRALAQTSAARAELETKRRRHRQQLSTVILQAARERLPQRLFETWQDPQVRAAWIATALDQALEKLPPGAWRIRHPADLDTNSCSALVQRLQDHLRQPPELVPDPQLPAGLVISCTGVVLDISTAGLLQDRDAIEARLLALVDLENGP